MFFLTHHMKAQAQPNPNPNPNPNFDSNPSQGYYDAKTLLGDLEKNVGNTSKTVIFLVFFLLRFGVVRPFLTQSDLSAENGLFRLKPKTSFLAQSKKSFFDSTFFELSFPTGGSSRKC